MANYDDVLANFRVQFCKVNAKALIEAKGVAELSDSEFDKILLRLDNHTIYESAKILREKWVLELDNGKTLYAEFLTSDMDRYTYQVTHQVTMDKAHKDDVEYDEFNLLGTVVSLGCIRLAVVDVKWIYDNCPLGTPVIIYDSEDPGPMGKPGTIYTDPTDTEKRGWDPTDPDPANPRDDSFESGTAIRSQAAWDQWENEREGWLSSLTPTDLQGWSTDSSVAGTRG